MPRADKRYTAGLMERLARTVPNTEGRTWHLEEGSQTYGRYWRVCERGPHGELYHDLAAGQTEADMQSALAHYLDGYSAGRDAADKRADAMHAALATIAMHAADSAENYEHARAGFTRLLKLANEALDA